MTETGLGEDSAGKAGGEQRSAASPGAEPLKAAVDDLVHARRYLKRAYRCLKKVSDDKSTSAADKDELGLLAELTDDLLMQVQAAALRIAPDELETAVPEEPPAGRE